LAMHRILTQGTLLSVMLCWVGSLLLCRVGSLLLVIPRIRMLSVRIMALSVGLLLSASMLRVVGLVLLLLFC